MSIIDLVIAQAARVERLQYLNKLLSRFSIPHLEVERKQLLKDVFK